MNSLSVCCLALCAAFSLPACSGAPPSPAGPRVQERELRIGPPAVAGQDGPMGTTALDTPTPPWVGAPGIVRTTAEIMAVAARQPRRVLDLNRPRYKKITPDRSNLPQNPNAVPDRVAPVLDRERAPTAAQTVATPTVDVARLADTGMLPPDTQGDIGPTQYLATLNGRFRTVSKFSGAADGVIDADSDVFFSAVTAGAGTSDPRVRYDRRTQRWIIVMITVATPNRYLVAVGNTAGTAGTIVAGTSWTFFQWSNTRTQGGGGAAACLGDYPTLGLDEDALYIGVNQFCGSPLTFDSTSLYVVRKSALINGPTPTLVVAQFDAVLPFGSSAGIYTPQGVDNFDSATDTGYFVGVDNASFGTLVLRRVASPGGTPSLSGDVTVAVPATSFPGTVPQQGGAPALDGLDDRLLQAVIRNGRLWTNHQIRIDATGAAAGGGDRVGVRWYELSGLANSPSLGQSGTVFDNAPSNPFFYWMGAVMPNGQGHVALGLSRSGAASVVNTAVTGRLASDPAGTMAAPSAYSNNSSFTYAVQGAGTQRWGDYSATSVDPDDDMTFWTLQQYVDAPNSYAVRLTRLLAPAPAVITAVAPATVAPGRTGLVVTVTGAATSGRGFFDPGPGFARRLAASFGAGVTVTNVAVTSATTLALTIDTAADAALGARTLTVTNPDGQTAALAGALTLGVNQPPIFGTVPANRTLFETGGGATTGVIGFQVGDPEGAPVTVTATSSNPSVIPAANIQLGGTGIERGLVLTSVGTFGSTTITLTASDGSLTATTTFVVTVALSAVPSAPQNLAATVIRNTLVFTWQAPASAATEPVVGYRLEAGLVPGDLLGALALGNTLGYTLTAPDGVFYLRVRAVTLAGTGPVSNEVRVAAGEAEPPLAPLALLATVQGTAVTVQWTENPLGPVIAGYQIQAGSAAGLTDIGAAPLAAAVRAFSVDAPPGTYFLRVVAVNAAGAGAASNEAVIHPGPGTCTVPATPAGFAATVQPGALGVRWDSALSGAIPAIYQLRAGTVSGASDIGVVDLGGGTTSAAGPVPPGPYFLRVVAANACGASAPSTEAAVTVP